MGNENVRHPIGVPSAGWIVEAPSEYEFTARAIKRVVVHKMTAFQELYIIETSHRGRALVLDGKWQSCEADEFIYHEALVHPAFVLHGAIRRVLIFGGAEGATAREVLRWPSITDVTMVDIDGEVIAECRKHLPTMHRNAFDDGRLNVVVDDAVHYLPKDPAKRDLIIFDVSDPVADGPSIPLFTREFFTAAKRALVPGGYLSIQSGPALGRGFGLVIRTLRQIFQTVLPYSACVPTYPGPWGFVLATDGATSLPPVEELNDRLSPIARGLKFLNGPALGAAFALSTHMQAGIESETGIATSASPALFF
jgi:spermidine synthase